MADIFSPTFIEYRDHINRLAKQGVILNSEAEFLWAQKIARAPLRSGEMRILYKKLQKIKKSPL